MPIIPTQYHNVLERICEVLDSKKLTQKDLCEYLGLKNKSFTEWKAGRSTSYMKKLPDIAKYLDVSIDYLWGNETDEKQFDIFSVPSITPVKKIKLPILGNVACGEPIWAEQDYDGYIEVEGGVRADFCLRCHGDSMIGARIYDGDIVLVKKQPQVENGEIAVVLINDEATLKRVAFYPEKQMLILKPENSNYQDMIFTGEELNEIKILGKAVAFQSIVR